MTEDTKKLVERLKAEAVLQNSNYREYAGALLSEAAAALLRVEGELEHMRERERFFAAQLGVPDGGQYRHDWIARLERALAAEARTEAMRRALVRLRDATPGNTNSATAEQFRTWVFAVAETALSDFPGGEGKGSSSAAEHSPASPDRSTAPHSAGGEG